MKPILEGWYGGDLFMTSIYGIRKYTNGSILRMHVDTLATHVVSCSKHLHLLNLIAQLSDSSHQCGPGRRPALATADPRPRRQRALRGDAAW